MIYEHHIIAILCRRHIAIKAQYKLDRTKFQRREQNGQIICPKDLQDESFPKWFQSDILHAKKMGETIDEDVLVLSFPPFNQTTSYSSIHAFGNHTCVYSVEGTLTTCDFAVAASFFQNCWSNVHAKNFNAANLEYMG